MELYRRIPIDFEKNGMPPYASSTQVDSLAHIDLKRIREWGLLDGAYHSGSLTWSRNGEETGSIGYNMVREDNRLVAFELQYRYRNSDADEWTPLQYRVQLEQTPCHYGRGRWWFRCPIVGCGRRCRILYHWGKYYICRKCTRCWYESQQWRCPLLRIVNRGWRSDEMYQKLKRFMYAGKPTRKYQRYLNVENRYSEAEMAEMERILMQRT